MTKKKFMVMDLIILTVIGIVLEVAGLYMKINVLINPESFWYVSLNTIFIIIAMFRWGYKGSIIALPLTLTTLISYEIFKGIDGYYYFIYLIGTSFVLINLIYFKLKVYCLLFYTV
jgi:hypothetical protein